MTHELKSWPKYFWAVATGEKTFDVRRRDRPYKVGDDVCLREWDQETQTYSGRQVVARIRYVQDGGQWGVDSDYCVLGLVVHRRAD